MLCSDDVATGISAMSSRPKIDRPCPLDAASQRGVGDYCKRCDHPVHQLDAMDADTRAQLRRSSTPVCVSYRVAVGMGAALAISMNPGYAAAPDNGTSLPASHQGAPHSLLESQGDATRAPMSPVGAPAQDDECEDVLEFVIVGGVSDPSTAEWIELDRSLPTLPVRHVEGSDES